MSQLDELRGQIDDIDAQLTALFLRRMEVTEQVGRWKQANGIPVLDTARELEVLAKMAALTDDPARKDDVTALYEAIMGISRRQQRKLLTEAGNEDYVRIQSALRAVRDPLTDPRVLYQGEPGAYSDEAAGHFFGEAVHRSHVATWEEVFLALKEGRADYGVLPIENSSTGSISQVYDLLARYGAHIVGEQTVKVEHCLMAPKGAVLEGITAVYSHEQGLAQCEEYLKQHPGWERCAVLNTAAAAKYVSQTGDVTKAAIGSRRAAALYGLEVLAEGINLNDDN